jgi:hypothetical protein
LRLIFNLERPMWRVLESAMASTREVIAPPIFAEDAATVIPPTPIAGQSYRDPVAGPASSPDGWPYAQLVNSAEWNQLMFQWSSLLSIMDKKGVLGWSDQTNYTEPSVSFGSDGTLYFWLQASGPDNGGAKDPVSEPLYWQTLASALSSNALPLGYFSGFTLSNNGGAPNTTVDTGPGTARSSDNTVDITLASSLSGILQSSGAWAAGNNQNKLDDGAKAINTCYHVFAIRKTSDGTADILFSLSATAPTMPSGYAGFVLINYVRTNASGNIIPFINKGDMTWYKTPIKDVTLSAISSQVGTYQLSLSSGIAVEALLYCEISGDQPAAYISSPDMTDLTPLGLGAGYVGGQSMQAGGGSALDISGQQLTMLSSSTGTVRARFKTDAAATTGLVIVTGGWRILR